MSSGKFPREVGQSRQAAGALGRGRSQGDEVGAAAAMDEARGARAGEAGGGARAGALAAVQAAAAVGHGRLAAGVTGAGACLA
ncbi:MAG: hypothetical protein WEC41_00290, partial [Dongiaceae bacterium]